MKLLRFTILAVCLMKTAHVLAQSDLRSELLSYEKSDTTAEVSITIEWPVSGGSQALIDSIQGYINVVSGAAIKGRESLNDFGEAEFAALSSSWQETYANDEEPGAAFWKTINITKTTETRRYVTYNCLLTDFAGGIHGFASRFGCTFRKSDGKIIPLLAVTDSPQLDALIKKGIMSYFEVTTDEDLANELFGDDVDNLPLPGEAPYLTDTGIVFIYSQYEIAPYSAGMITFEIPFNDIRPFLTPEAQELLP